MNPRLESLLDHLVRHLDGTRLRAIDERFRRALKWKAVDRLPLVLCAPLPEDSVFEPFPVSQMFDDPEKMLYNELVYAFGTSIAHHHLVNDDLPCTVRANFGTVVIASMFGAPVRQIGNNPPWIVRSEGEDLSLENVLEHDPFDMSRGWAPRVFETMEAYQAILDGVPELRDLIRVVLPDLQGPFDTLELIVGSDLYAELVDAEDLVHAALDCVAETQIELAKRLAPLVTDGPEGFCHQHAVALRGNMLLREDSVLMMSPKMYRGQIAKHDERVLETLGGGAVHSCGDLGSHAAAFLELPHIRSLDIGQPERNDIGSIYTLAREREIPLIRVTVPEEELTSGRVLDRFPTGMVLCHRATSWEEGRRVVDAYLSAAESRCVPH